MQRPHWLNGWSLDFLLISTKETQICADPDYMFTRTHVDLIVEINHWLLVAFSLLWLLSLISSTAVSTPVYFTNHD